MMQISNIQSVYLNITLVQVSRAFVTLVRLHPYFITGFVRLYPYSVHRGNHYPRGSMSSSVTMMEMFSYFSSFKAALHSLAFSIVSKIALNLSLTNTLNFLIAHSFSVRVNLSAIVL